MVARKLPRQKYLLRYAISFFMISLRWSDARYKASELFTSTGYTTLFPEGEETYPRSGAILLLISPRLITQTGTVNNCRINAGKEALDETTV